MKVWIDERECMGAGTCEQIVPEVFVAKGDGLWAVREPASHFEVETVFDGGTEPGHGPDGEAGSARVPQGLHDAVAEAIEECPAECIYVAS